MLKHIVLGVGVGVVSWLAGPAAALACGQVACEQPVRLLGSPGREVPRNLVYFKVLIAEPGELTLRTKDGTAIPASIRQIGDDRVFAPEEPLAQGTEAELVYTLRCSSTTPLPSPKVYAFRAGPDGEVRSRSGGLELTAQGVAFPGRMNSEASFAQIRYFTPDATGAAAHLEENSASVDGNALGVESDLNGLSEVRVQSMCLPVTAQAARDSCGILSAVPPGRHTLEVWTHVIGQVGTSEHARLEFETRCDAQPCTSPATTRPLAPSRPSTPSSAGAAATPLPAAAGSGAPAPADAAGTQRADIPAPNDDRASEPAANSSCASTGARRSGRTALAAFGLFAVALGQRRRQRRSSALA